jgi:hypothetical protein
MNLQSVVATHKIIGLIATIFIIILSITGILLMHTDDLDLADTYVENKKLLSIYDITPDTAPVSFQLKDNYITQLDDHLYFNDIDLMNTKERLIGGVSIDGIYVAGFVYSLVLITSQGEVIEPLTQAHGVPEAIEAIGTINDRLVVNSGQGLKSTDSNMTVWNDHFEQAVEWSSPVNTPGPLLESIMNAYLGDGLPLERVVLDIHSGRIMGTTGVILVDVAVVLFLVLSISGWLAWFKRRALQKLVEDEE